MPLLGTNLRPAPCLHPVAALSRVGLHHPAPSSGEPRASRLLSVTQLCRHHAMTFRVTAGVQKQVFKPPGVFGVHCTDIALL